VKEFPQNEDLNPKLLIEIIKFKKKVETLKIKNQNTKKMNWSSKQF